jgi:pyridoxine 5-phosphate synthase
MARLGVNIDHVATLRQARGVDYPDPVEAALAAERAGAGAITFHLREDRRHIQDHDLLRLRQQIHVHLNQELAPIDEMVELALKIRPHEVCLVPERRQELTTEGGLDAAGLSARLAPMIARLKDAGVGVSLFIDPIERQVEAAAALGADFVEIHTGAYASLADRDLAERYLSGVDSPRALKAAKLKLGEATAAELCKIRDAVRAARAAGLKPNAGHGLNYGNVAPIAAIAGIQWLHIGHAIVARAIAVGMGRAVSEMLELAGGGRSAAPRARVASATASRRSRMTRA